MNVPKPTPPLNFPDFTDKRVIDATLDKLDTRNINRRDFLQLVSAGIALTGTSALLSACGRTSNSAVISGAGGKGSGKLAFLIMTNQLQYDVQMAASTQAISKELGFTYTGLNGQLSDSVQLNEYNQVAGEGYQAVIVHSPDGGDIKSITTSAQQQKIYTGNVWGTLAWFTPFDVGQYYTLYAQPDEYLVEGLVVKVLCDALGGKGNIVRVTGVQGNSTDIIRTAGADNALKQYPNIHLLGQLPGDWNSESSQKAMSSLLAKYPDIQGVIAQNDDEATGVVAALKAVGRVPGKDVLVVGADGTNLGAERIKSGEQLGSTGNVPGYAGFFLETRMYDVLHGWKPSAGERMMEWQSIILTKANVDAYINRYVNLPPGKIFSAKLMSHVMSPKNWDPQFLVYPMDLDTLFIDNPKPSGYQYPTEYVNAQQSGLFAKVAAEYKDHYRHPVLGPSPAV